MIRTADLADVYRHGLDKARTKGYTGCFAKSYAEGYAEGYVEGYVETLEHIICSLLTYYPSVEVAEIAGVPLETVEEIKSKKDNEEH